MSALNAFALMYDKGLSSVAVLDVDQKVVANLSSSDLRWLEYDLVGHLALPVMLFLAVMSGCRNPGPVISAGLDSSVLHVMTLMCDNDIHHVHITGSKGEQCSIITPSDILKLICA